MVTQLLYLMDVFLDQAVASDLLRKSHSDFYKLLIEDRHPLENGIPTLYALILYKLILVFFLSFSFCSPKM